MDGGVLDLLLGLAQVQVPRSGLGTGCNAVPMKAEAATDGRGGCALEGGQRWSKVQPAAAAALSWVG